MRQLPRWASDTIDYPRMNPWLPKSVIALRDYSLSKFLSDLIAGLTVGLVALPLAMAFAISSGVPPQAGIYTAILSGFLISALGGSRVQIGGPTGAFVVVIYDIIAKHGMDGLFTCTLMAGILLVLLGVTGMGTAVKYIPRPVVIGFTNGIALLIASTQIKDFFGLRIDNVPGAFWPRLEAIVANFYTISIPAAILASTAVAIILLARIITPRIPGSIIVLFGGTAAAILFRLPVETIGTRFGEIPAALPHFAIPQLRPELFPPLLSPALTITMLGAIESLLSATVADRMSGDQHNPNVELIAQGVANIISPLVGGLPATGAIARTATNVRSGAQTPVAGMIHALTILAILLFAAPLAKFIPLSILAAILMVVSYNMGEWREIPQLLKLTRTDISVWVVTFALTVFADLTVAVEAGMILAALLFIRRVAVTTTVTEVTPEYIAQGRPHSLQDKVIPDHVRIFRIHGPFLFGAADKITNIAKRISDLPPIVILRLRNMTAIDATGLQALEDLAATLHQSGRTLILCGARQQPERFMKLAEFENRVGRENICDSVQDALDRANQIAAGVST